MGVLLSSFHLNGHIIGFCPQTQKFVQSNKQYHRKVLLSVFPLIGHIIEFCPETQKLEPLPNKTPSVTLRVQRLKQHHKRQNVSYDFVFF